MKNRVLGKKVEKKKQNIFVEKNLEKKNLLEFCTKKHVWARPNNSPPRENKELFVHKGGR